MGLENNFNIYSFLISFSASSLAVLSSMFLLEIIKILRNNVLTISMLMYLRNFDVDHHVQLLLSLVIVL